MWRNPVYLAVVLLLGLFLIQDVWTTWRTVAAAPRAAVAGLGVGGRPRDVDMTRFRRMIEQGRLSEREALFYRRAETDR